VGHAARAEEMCAVYIKYYSDKHISTAVRDRKGMFCGRHGIQTGSGVHTASSASY